MKMDDVIRPFPAYPQQSGWAATNVPVSAFDPIGELIVNPFQAMAIYLRLRMSQAMLKARGIEIALVRHMGSAVNVVVITKDQMVTLTDEDDVAFPSDAFLAKLRLLF
jgi:hypothetical protein